MKKVFNFRFFVLLFLEFVLGHLFAVYVCKSEIFGLVLLCVVLAVSIVFTIVLCFFKRKVAKYVLTAFVCVLLLFATMGLSLLRIGLIQKVNELPKGRYEVSGKVVKIKNGGEVITIENITLNKDFKCYSTQQMKVYLDSVTNEEINLGDEVSFSAYLYFDVQPELSGSVLKYNYNSVQNFEVEKSKGLDAKIRNSVKDTLYKNATDTEVAEIEYAMLFGDKSFLNEELNNSYTASGLAHLLAVSGLHVGFIIALLSKLLDKLFRNKVWVAFGVKSILILGYLVLCNFTTSATRAVIMSMVLMYGTARGRKSDGVSALAFAGCVILLVNPYEFYNVGFQLSFMVVFGLFGVAPKINNFLGKVLPNWLAGSLSVAISSQLVSTPIILHYFNSTSLISVIVNLFVIPYVSFAFTLLFIAVILAELIPPIGFVLKVPNLLYKLLNIVVNAVAKLPFGITFENLGVLGLLFMTFAIIICSQFNLDKRSRKISITTASVVCIIFCIIKGW